MHGLGSRGLRHRAKQENIGRIDIHLPTDQTKEKRPVELSPSLRNGSEKHHPSTCDCEVVAASGLREAYVFVWMPKFKSAIASTRNSKE